MNTKKIVITGGPGTGKSSIINELIKRNYFCFEEISREIILKAREDGIEQLFLNEPLRFSKMLLDGREKQFFEANKSNKPTVFFDRGLPDVLAYMHFIGDSYPKSFDTTCKQHKYDQVFILAPWKEIFSSDNERYENFEQAVEIHKNLINTYKNYNYKLIDVPFGSIASRTDFILNMAKTL